jgi:gliding motility-associated-like protein
VSSSNSATGIAAGSYSINVSDSLACSSMVNVTITESSAIVPAVVSTLNEPCFGDSKGEVQLGASGGTPVYQYEISSDGINFTPSPNGNSTGLIAGAYTARITDANGCPKTIPFAITEPSQIVAIFTNDSVKCFGESNGSIAATASGGSPNYTYNFSNGQTNSNGVLTSLPAGAYSVTVSDSKGCFQVLNTTVYQPDSLELIVNPTDATINLGQSVQLQAASNYSAITYQWTPSYGLSCTDCDAPVSTTYQSITYTLTGTVNPNGKACTATIKIPVTVIPNYNMYIPNAFTPNGDGVNDYFEIFGNKAALKFVEVQIFDRWGEKVFDSNDINFKWDGIYKGAQLNPGTFVYQIKAVFLDNHSEDVYKGSLLLLR